MTDEIRKVIAAHYETGALSGYSPESAADDIITALHAAGYTIEPEWSDDLSKAPRDGQRFLGYMKYANGTPWISELAWDGSTFYETVSGQAAAPLYWRPRPTPPKESTDDG